MKGQLNISSATAPTLPADSRSPIRRLTVLTVVRSLAVILAGVIGGILASPAQAQPELISINAAGTATGNDQSGSGLFFANQATSADGRFVAFPSGASDLVSGVVDSNGTRDIFLRDRMTGTTTLISINTTGTASSSAFAHHANQISVSPNGRFVAFVSLASDLVEGITTSGGFLNVFVRDTCFGADGGCTAKTSLVSVNAAGTDGGNQDSGSPLFSPDSTRVAFTSSASNLVAAANTNVSNLYLRDLSAGTTTLVSINAAGTASGDDVTFGPVAFSADGNRIAFQSAASNLTNIADANGTADVFVRDLTMNTTFLVSVTLAGTTGPNGSLLGGMSADGNRVVFQSFDFTSDLAGIPEGNGVGLADVFVRDLAAGTTTVVSINADGTAGGNHHSESPTISADGRFVAFASRALNLGLPLKSHTLLDIFVRDLLNNTTTLVSVNSAGTAGANNESSGPRISLDGSRVLFRSLATDLVGGISDENNALDVVVRDLGTSTTALASINAAGTGTGNAASNLMGFTGDISLVTFWSAATDLTSLTDNNPGADVFAFVVTAEPGPGPGPGPDADLENLVTRFYTDVLDRDPEPAGAAAWLAFLQANCNPAGFDTLARNFFGSEEFVKTKRLTLGLLVSKFYLALLDRSPEPGGLAAWINVLRQARLAIALAGFIPSPEFRGLLPNRADPGAVAAVVERLYTQILGRASEPAGKAAWVDYIVTTGDLEGAAQGFLTSPEFEAKALTFPEFVTILYLTFLDRQPEQAGLDAWVNLMTEAMLLVINAGFIPSPEFQGLSAGLCS